MTSNYLFFRVMGDDIDDLLDEVESKFCRHEKKKAIEVHKPKSGIEKKSTR